MTTTKATPDVEVSKKETKGEKLVNAERERENREESKKVSQSFIRLHKEMRDYSRNLQSVPFYCKTVLQAYLQIIQVL